MKLITSALLASTVSAFAPAQQKTSSTALNADRMWDKMVDPTERSKAVPFLPRPINLDGSMVGDVGFDPFYLSSIQKDFSGFIQPNQWEDKGEGLPTLYWMREAELKHGRVAMLAWAGWVAVDQGARFPGAGEPFVSVPSSLAAHDIMVDNGVMGAMLLGAGLIELAFGSVLVQVAKGESDREAGDFQLGVGMLAKKTDAQVADMKLKELTHCRLAMLAFSGVVTQAALSDATSSFPYFN